MEDILYRLIKAYEEEGYEVSVGLNPVRESINGQFAYIQKVQQENQPHPENDPYLYPLFYPKSKESRCLTTLGIERIKRLLPSRINSRRANQVVNDGFVQTAGGISIDELFFLSLILSRFKPKFGFFIGIAFGWSTLAIGMLAPQTRLYGIDNLSEGEKAATGFDLAIKMGKKLDLDLELSVGTSPEDIPSIMQRIPGPVDFSFIDGKHTDEQILLDFSAVLPYMDQRSIILFHDVVGVGITMLKGWNAVTAIAEKNGYSHAIMRRTASGMGILYRNTTPEETEIILGFVQRYGYFSPI